MPKEANSWVVGITSFDWIREAIAERTEEISASVKAPSTQGYILTLVELAGAEAFMGDDPKPAIKIGYGKRSRLVQCIEPPPANLGERAPFIQQQLRDTLPERARSAVRDLLRQCGVLGILPHVQVPYAQRRQQKPVFQIPEPLLVDWLKLRPQILG